MRFNSPHSSAIGSSNGQSQESAKWVHQNERFIQLEDLLKNTNSMKDTLAFSRKIHISHIVSNANATFRVHTSLQKL